LVAIFKFNMTAHTQLVKSLNNALNGFGVPENMAIYTKLMSICASHTEILAKHDLIISHNKVQDGRLYYVNNIINNARNGFLDTEKMGIYTTIK
jgi:hypothetical protein